MRLYEYEGKALLARYGIPIPGGGLWPDHLPQVNYPVVVKAQLLEGGRGKRGGIQQAADADTIERAAQALLAGSVELPAAEAVLVEHKLTIARELYLALVTDRERGEPVLLASRKGGVEIESVAEEEILRIPLHPLMNVPTWAARHLVATFGLEHHHEPTLLQYLQALWQLLQREDCLLVEINPLILTGDDALVAADARVIVDEGARFRHREWRPSHDGTAFEQRCAAAGASGVEMAGDIAILTSGAGLGMATVDMVAALGGRMRCLVDFGGAIFGGAEALTPIIAAVADLQPRAILINCFLQVARCDTLAEAIAQALSDRLAPASIVLRLRGNRAAEARALLTPMGFTVTEAMPVASQAVVDAVHRGAWN